jgi:hypothetical protein
MPDSLSLQAVVPFVSSLVVLLQNVMGTMFGPEEAGTSEDGNPTPTLGQMHDTLMNMETIVSCVLHDFRLSNASQLLGADLGFWVLPRSTAWFSQFLMYEYDNARWVENFRLTKESVFRMADMLSPYVQKQDTRFHHAIPAMVKVAVTLYKLCQGASLLICSEQFALGKSTICETVQDIVRAVNVHFRQEIAWPSGNRLLQCMADFKDWCGLPGVVGVIDGTHFHIKKPSIGPEDYYYFKSGGFTIQYQAVVDRYKRFLDLSVGMPGSTNDVRVLRWSSLYRLATTTNQLFDIAYSQEGFSPYLIGDKDYPLFPWLITPYRDLPTGNRSLQERLFNRKLSTGRCVVENAFGFLKQSFRELGRQSELHVTSFPYVIVACCLLHNMLLNQDLDEVALLLEVCFYTERCCFW